jgi:hypothetical protein
VYGNLAGVGGPKLGPPRRANTPRKLCGKSEGGNAALSWRKSRDYNWFIKDEKVFYEPYIGVMKNDRSVETMIWVLAGITALLFVLTIVSLLFRLW